MRSTLAVLFVALPVLAAVCPDAPAAQAEGRPTLVTTESCVAKIHTGNLSIPPRLVASPDNRHEVHPVSRFGKPLIIALDGQAFGPGLQGFYDGTMTFSPDSKRLAYVAGAPQKGARVSMVLDGVEGKQYDNIGMTALTFSPNSKRFAYPAKKGDVWLVVVDGKETKGYEGVIGPIAFDDEGAHIAYAAKAEGKWFIVADGREGDPYDFAFNPVFSRDGGRLAYSAKSGEERFVIVDGVRQKAYDDLAISPAVFSPDGKHLCYPAKRGDSWFVVADGVEGPAYEAVLHPVYSPDSSRLGCYARRGDKVFLVVDGVEGMPYDQIAWLTFSPDSRRVAYVGFFGENPSIPTVVVDGQAGSTYDLVFSLTFSPDSKHLAYLAKRKGKYVIVVDGVETKPYDGTFWGTQIVFDSPTHLHTLLRYGSDLDPYCVEVEIAE